MMGSAAAMLLGAATANTATTGTPAAATAPEGTDFLAALMAATSLPVAAAATGAALPTESVATSDEPVTPDGEGEPSAELAAAVAAMLVAVAPAAEAGAGSGDGAEAAALPPQEGESSAAAPDAALQRFLHALSQRLATGTPDATDAAAPTPAADPMLAPMPAPARLDSAAAATLAAARPIELLAPAEAPTQPNAQSAASTLASTMGSTSTAQAAAPAAAQTVHAAVGAPRWADELGSKMVLMSLNGQHEGSLSLTPEHLGPLEVRVSVNQGTANVWFGSQHADTRAALTEALPRLRELFADAGLAMGHAGVSHQAPRQGTREGEVPRIGGSTGEVASTDVVTTPAMRRVALGLVDTYA